MERAPALSEDPAERDERHVSLKGTGLLSVETSLRERYPDRDEEWYVEEIDRIRRDAAFEAGSVTVDESGTLVAVGL